MATVSAPGICVTNPLSCVRVFVGLDSEFSTVGHPLMGDLISGTGGARKIRWASNTHQGKRGGARVIYYYYNQTMPIFLFTAYGKNQKADLTMKEKSLLGKVIEQLIETYEGDNYE